MDELAKCRHCGDVIGVYEPMIVLAEGEARKTSRLNEDDTAGDCFHHACFVQAHGDESIT